MGEETDMTTWDIDQHPLTYEPQIDQHPNNIDIIHNPLQTYYQKSIQNPQIQKTGKYLEISKILHLNIGKAFQNKLDKLQIELIKIKLKIIIIIEHGLTDDNLRSMMNLNGYDLITSYCREENVWEEVAIDIKDDFF